MDTNTEDTGQPVTLEPDGPVTTLTLNRPERLNSLDWDGVDALDRALDRIARHEPRALILTGAGRGFCAGLDIKMPDPLGQEGEILDFLAKQERIAGVIVRLKELQIPVIAAVRGPATGAGLALALAADIRVAASDSVFSAAFIRIGISSCDVGVSYLLPRLVGPGLAAEMMLTGNLVDGTRALDIGLVNHLDDDPVARARELALDIAQNSPVAVRMTKEGLAHAVDAPSLRAAVAFENRNQVITSRTAEAVEALRAFREKRPAQFE